ncbi:MAG: hypothetical protein AAFX99_12585, partial [Myxococcota bacterium]
YVEEPLPLLWSACHSLNLSEPAGHSAELARSYILNALLVAQSPSLRPIADRMCARALETAEVVGDPLTTAFVALRVAICDIYIARWDSAARHLKQASSIAEAAHNPRHLLEVYSVWSLVERYQGRFASSQACCLKASEHSQDVHDAQAQLWPPLGRAQDDLRLGRITSAAQIFPTLVMDDATSTTDRLLYHGLEALLLLRQDNPVMARAAADAILALLNNAPVAYWLEQPLAVACEVLLQVWRDAPETAPQRLKQSAVVACDAMRRFAGRFPFAKPNSALLDGLLFYLQDNPRRAQKAWERAVRLGDALAMPYQAGRAHLELARLRAARDQPVGTVNHRRAAVDLLTPLGCLKGDPFRLETLQVM